MSPNGVTLARCGSCGATYFPRRLLCASCGGARLRPVSATTAQVEQVTVLRAAAGGDGPPARLATVRTPEGVRLVVRLLDDLPPGAVALLSEEGGAVAARRSQ